MQAPATASDLERRKQVRVRLRSDLSFTEQKYEGRTYYVYKDPVSLRYYRFKEQERYLLDLMDGETTLEQAQKSFELRFRPERLSLEHLESFATQLLNAGLVQNESPQAGKQLYDRYRKRRRRTVGQALLNILYIKIPLYDPDRLLNWMLPKLKFIFTLWFFAVSVALMIAALGLVLIEWDMFVSKLPSAEQFFSFQTVLYLWAALGLVKIIHEFGHGLSCKAFGGEVHEMGALFLVFSPCLFCNVSDAWTLPNKWHRIIIGGAGIYVELVIASVATFIWWNTDSGTLINNLCMSMMLVCSVSTVVFNANPLMRFDGYYILSDWMEIPNLRDRSNKYLLAMVQEYCLGMEVPPEPYMTRTRQLFFVSYAIVSYLYRWFVTFGILYFMYTFLEPYKLGAVSYLLGTGALGTMVGWPIYRLFRALYKRGRVPDMKPARMWFSIGVVVAVLVLIMTIPFPVRVKGLALIQAKPEHGGRVMTPEQGGFLEQLLVKDGQRVRARDPLARFKNPELEISFRLNQSKQQHLRDHRQRLVSLGTGAATAELASVDAELSGLQQGYKELARQYEQLTLRAPCEGVVMSLPRIEDQGKWMESGETFCQIGNEKSLRAILLVETADRELAAKGDRAWIRIHGRGYNYWPGTVSSVAAVEAKEVPPQLSNMGGGDIPAQEDPQTRALVPQHQHYTVFVDFDEIDDAIHPGTLGRVKIMTEPRTLGWRFKRYMATTFNWHLWF